MSFHLYSNVLIQIRKKPSQRIVCDGLLFSLYGCSSKAHFAFTE